MKIGKIILGVFAGLVVLVMISSAAGMRSRTTRIEGVPKPEPTGPVTVTALLRETQRILDENFPNGNWIDYDPETAAVQIYLYNDAFTVDALNAALQDIKYLNKWNATLQQLAELETETRARFAEYGHPELTTAISLVNPEDLSQIFATVSGGSVVFDLVDATPPGELISSGADRTRAAFGAADTRTFVVNTSSHKYHKPTCGAVREIKDDNRWDFVGTREEVEALGYEPCGLCGG